MSLRELLGASTKRPHSGEKSYSCQIERDMISPENSQKTMEKLRNVAVEFQQKLAQGFH